MRDFLIAFAPPLAVIALAALLVWWRIRHANAAWPVLNRERGLLIDKAIAGTLSAEERTHLDELNAYADRYVARVAPRPNVATFELVVVEGGSIAIHCLMCGRISGNPLDISERHCGRCHVFHEDSGAGMVFKRV